MTKDIIFYRVEILFFKTRNSSFFGTNHTPRDSGLDM